MARKKIGDVVPLRSNNAGKDFGPIGPSGGLKKIGPLKFTCECGKVFSSGDPRVQRLTSDAWKCPSCKVVLVRDQGQYIVDIGGEGIELDDGDPGIWPTDAEAAKSIKETGKYPGEPGGLTDFAKPANRFAGSGVTPEKVAVERVTQARSIVNGPIEVSVGYPEMKFGVDYSNFSTPNVWLKTTVECAEQVAPMIERLHAVAAAQVHALFEEHHREFKRMLAEVKGE